MTLTDIALFFLLFFVGYFVWNHLDVSRIARSSAKKFCDKTGVQFLDQNVVLKKISIGRSPYSLFAFRRRYNFEFSSVGDRRYQGAVHLLGQRVVTIDLEPYKTADTILSE